MKTSPAILIAGTHSGCGKTTITLGIMAALQKRGLNIQPFKCGPDFIDPTLHHMVTGRISRNLDVRMCGTAFTKNAFLANNSNADCSVVEGVMGLFDGGDGSAASLAKTLNIPVVLVIDVRSAAESIAAVAKGFTSLDPDLNVCGIICNRVGSAKHKQMIADAVEKYCNVPILGFVPRNETVTIPSRHLGLHMGEENPLKQEGQGQLSDIIENHIDLDLLLKLAAQAETKRNITPPTDSPSKTSVKIGVARDEAFCFYYEDNLDLLQSFGAKIIPFSPLHDSTLPEGLQGIYLGGGYPELYARQLSENSSMRKKLKELADKGLPIYGECGGFMYLTSSITDLEEQTFPMTGVFPFASRMQSRLRRLGYRRPTMTQNTILASKDTVLHGHEFHYSTINNNIDYPCCYKLDDGRSEGYTYKNTLAGYVHLHWGQTPEVAENFVQTCRQF